MRRNLRIFRCTSTLPCQRIAPAHWAIRSNNHGILNAHFAENYTLADTERPYQPILLSQQTKTYRFKLIVELRRTSVDTLVTHPIFTPRSSLFATSASTFAKSNRS